MQTIEEAAHVYIHPDGHEIVFDTDSMELVAIDADAQKAVYLPIGVLGLVELGKKLVALGSKLERQGLCMSRF